MCVTTSSLSTPAQEHGTEAGLDAWEAARDLATEIGADARFSSWGEFGRIAVNVDTVYRGIDSEYQPADIVTNFRHMAELEAGG